MIKNNKLKIAIALSLVFVVGFIIISGQFNKTEEVIAQEEKAYSVEVLKTEFVSAEGFLEYSAIIKNRDMEEVVFPTVANIKTIHVKEGESVHEGQLLVTLEDDTAVRQEETTYQAMVSAEATMNSAKSNLDLAQMQYDKDLEDQKNDTQYKTLKENYENSTENVENLQNEVDAINLELEPLNEQLDDLNAELEILEQEKTDIAAEKDAKETALNTAKDELLLDSENAELQAKVDELQLEYNDLEEQLNQIETEIENKNNEITAKNEEISLKEVSLGKDAKEAQLVAAQTENEANRIAYEAKEAEMEIQLAASKNARDTSSFTYDSAKASYESAKSNHESAKNAIEDLNYYAKTSGVILAITQSEGEVATPLVPIMVVGTDDLVAEFGVSSQDVSKISSGNHAVVTRGEDSYSAEVLSVSVVPDETSRTYLTDVLLNNTSDEFLIGELVSVKVYTGSEAGIYLPITVILNDGQDYVYVVENSRATRKNIEIISISDNNVMVSGLTAEDLVISKGMKTIKSGYLVSIVE